MRTVDELTTSAPADVCFQVAADVEGWPAILPHYRWVKFREKQGFANGIVEMAAWRDFPFVRYPTWWLSEMEHDPSRQTILYRHIAGVTKGMDVSWEVSDQGETTLLRIVHDWSGPRWPLIGAFAANTVIGPHFVQHIASRTLKGIADEAERRARS